VLWPSSIVFLSPEEFPLPVLPIFSLTFMVVFPSFLALKNDRSSIPGTFHNHPSWLDAKTDPNFGSEIPDGFISSDNPAASPPSPSHFPPPLCAPSIVPLRFSHDVDRSLHRFAPLPMAAVCLTSPIIVVPRWPPLFRQRLPSF